MNNLELAGICLVMLLIGGIAGVRIGFKIACKSVKWGIQKYKPELFEHFKDMEKIMKRGRND